MHLRSKERKKKNNRKKSV